ncbi:transposase [Enterococcus sp. CWB-B31]|uniref:transposase n=1 Tax=Enterococcus sp. CWB-B31 TaxID=2885159 RepID=UPI001E643C2E|nr:transposase [Enterococcus sp. CWB-B31]MCB5954592.1 transposase [Enterococcus sp. CWB-B31]
MTELEKQLMVQVERLTIQNEKQAQQIQELIHQLTTMNRRMFGVSSEQTPSDQLSLFEDESSFKEPEPTEEKAVEMETVSYQRKKFKGQRAFLTKDLPILRKTMSFPVMSRSVCVVLQHFTLWGEKKYGQSWNLFPHI